MTKIFICKEIEFKDKDYFIGFFEELKDELIIIKDNQGNFKCFSAVCPHLAGEVCFKNKNLFCKWHGLRFNDEGLTINSKIKLKLKQYNLENIKGDLFIDAK